MPLRFGAFTLDTAARELRRDGTLVPLSPKAFRLLELLVAARPGTVSRDVLIGELWPDVIVEPGNLHGLVSEIRSATAADVIRTVHRVGYAFDATAADVSADRWSILIGDEEIPLRSGVNGVGRDPRGTVVLHAPEVSRHHARLVAADDGVTLEDLGSKNGTYVGRQRVHGSIELDDGAEIVIGTTTLRLVRVRSLPSTLTRG